MMYFLYERNPGLGAKWRKIDENRSVFALYKIAEKGFGRAAFETEPNGTVRKAFWGKKSSPYWKYYITRKTEAEINH